MRQIDISDENDIGVRIIGIDPPNYERIAGLSFVDGDQSVYPNMVGGKMVIVNGRYASQFGVEVGDTVTLDGDHGPLTVEIGAIGLDYLNIKLPTMYMEQTSLTREFGIRNDVFLLINHEEGADLEQLEEDLQAATRSYPGFGIISREQLREGQEKVAQSGSIGMNIVLPGPAGSCKRAGHQRD